MSTRDAFPPLIIVAPNLGTAARAAELEAYPWSGGEHGDMDSGRISRLAVDSEVVIVALEPDGDQAGALAREVACRLKRAVGLVFLETPEELISLGVPRLASACELVEPPAPPRGCEPWRPYPLEALPGAIAALAREAAESIGCDASLVALPALIVCAGAVGLSRDVRIKDGKRGWREPLVLWGCAVGESGTAKSPALDLAEAPLLELEADARRGHKRALAAWEEACAEESAAAKEEKRKPELPPKPTAKRLVIKDATIEAVARILPDTPRGLVVVRDELSAWFKSWGEYKGHASGDAAKWLELYGARALIVDRVLSGGSGYVERAAVSVCGGTQPGILGRVLSPEHLESGCAARILFAYPPRRARRWRDGTIEDETADAYAGIVRALTLLAPRLLRHPDGGSSLVPEGIPLSVEAREVFARWVDELGAEALDHEGAAASSASKLEGAAARLALLIELAEAATGDLAARAIAAEDAALAAEGTAAAKRTLDPGGASDFDREAAEAAAVAARDARRAAERAISAWSASVREVSADAMRRGIALARWHWAEARRLLALLGDGGESESPEDRERRELLGWIERRGGEVSPADLTRGPRRFRKAGGSKPAAEALQDLVDLGLGEWVVEWRRRPGAPSRRFRIRRSEEEPAGGGGGGGETPLDGGSGTDSSASAASAPGPSSAELGLEEEAVWTA